MLRQTIAVRANHDDGEVGKFWQSRFRAVRVLDEEALLACAAHVDLNPIRAALLTRLNLSPAAWCELVSDFGRLFSTVAGHPRTIDGSRHGPHRRRFRLTPRVRELLPVEK